MPRRANQTSFRPGPDARRHVFTRAERRRGYRNAMAGSDAHVVAWVFRRVRSHYRRLRRESA
jgi:hypothetical protein